MAGRVFTNSPHSRGEAGEASSGSERAVGTGYIFGIGEPLHMDIARRSKYVQEANGNKAQSLTFHQQSLR